MRLLYRLRVVAAAWLLAALVAPDALARPEYLTKYLADPMRPPGMEGCGTCHLKPEGGGARNDFGAAFDAAGRDITPLLRAGYPSHFTVASATLPDGTTFFMADPSSKVVVVERGNQRVVVNVADIAIPKAAPLPPASNRMTFFVSSQGLEQGGRLGGLAGADRLCQALATEAGAADRGWRAYLSTSFKGRAAVNAGDRIGSGPWHNYAGVLVARGPVELHQQTALSEGLFLTERGEAVDPAAAVFTGTLPTGMADIDRTCGNWTTNAGGEAAVGHPGGAWNAVGTASCSVSGGALAPRLYCFSSP